MRPPHAVSIDLAEIARSETPEGLLAGFNRRELAKGYLLSGPNCATNQVFIVRSGRLKVYISGGNRELSLGFLECGDIYTTHTPTYVQAVAPSSIWVADTRLFAQKLINEPAITPVMMRVLGRLLSDAVTLVEDLAFREVPARLARFFIGLAERRGQIVDEGWLIPLDLGMQDIAELLGATRQTISALINQWERDGLILRRGRRAYLIPSLDALGQLFPENV